MSTKKYFKPFYILLSISLVLGCSSDDTKNNTKTTGTSRPTVPVLDSQIRIGTQVWMTKNLNVSRYRNGDAILQVNDPSAWSSLTVGAWCYYENNNANGTTYGKLYNWYAVNDPRGLAPIGFHVPSDDEWTTLTTFLGGYTVAGGKIKATYGWNTPNTDATNSSGFTGLSGGYRFYSGDFSNIGFYSYWWSSSEGEPGTAWSRYLYFSNSWVTRLNTNKNFGFFVRCLKN